MAKGIEKLISEVFATVIMFIVAVTLLSELSLQSELIKSLSFLFGVTIMVAIIALIIKLKDEFL